jgi:DNA ligase-1
VKLAGLVRVHRAVAGASGRLEKVRRMADLLDRLEPDLAPVAVAYLSGRMPHGKIGVGPATLDEVLPVESADEAGLELSEVDRVLRRIGEESGRGSRARRREALEGLLGRATEEEQAFLARLVLGELRQGAQEGLALEAVAESAGVEPARIRRAVMLRGEAGEVARVALGEGAGALESFSLELFRPVKPMLARTADGMEGALERLGRAALEWKLDGARLQVHKDGGEVRVFTRRLNEKTDAVPEVVEAVAALPADELVLDGEAVALREDGRPRPFQETMRRFGRDSAAAELREELPLSPFFFDCLYLEGVSLLELPARQRQRALEDVVPEVRRVPRLVTGGPEEARAFLEGALEAGHEGVIAKSLDAEYRAGRRGHEWLKVKPVHTADLVVLAAEWGHGRREGWLSNVHLGARVPAAGDGGGEGASDAGEESRCPYPQGFAMVGKTFKGMTDRMLEWQTERFLELERGRAGGTVHLEPEVVAEVAFDGVQESPTYAAGLSLRFARVKGYRRDKGPEDADAVEALRAIREGRR